MRCYVEPAEWTGDEIALDREESHHLAHVLRGTPGLTVDLFDGQGRQAVAEVVRSDRHQVTVRVLETSSLPKPEINVCLVQSLVREQKMDWIIQKATELQVSRLVPVRTDHSLVRLDGRQVEKKAARWQKIALNAAKQCGLAWLPRIEPVRPLAAFLEEVPPFDLFAVGSLERTARPLHEVVAAAKQRDPHHVGILVGPEGDLTADELRKVCEAGAEPVSLGACTLRAETAALYMLSILNYEFL